MIQKQIQSKILCFLAMACLALGWGVYGLDAQSNDIETLKKERDVLKKQNEALEQKVMEMEIKILNREPAKGDESEQLKQLIDKLQALIKENLTVTIRQENGLDQRVSELNNALIKETIEKNLIEIQLKEAKNQANMFNAEKSNLASKISSLQKELNELKLSNKDVIVLLDEAKSLKEANDEISRRNAQMQATIQSFFAEKTVYDAKIDELQQSLRKEINDKSEYAKQLKLSGDKLNALTVENTELKIKYASISKELSGIKEMLSKETSERLQETEKLNEANAQITVLTKENTSLKTDNDSLKKILKQNEDKIAVDIQALSEYEKQVTVLTREIRTLSQTASQLKEENARLASGENDTLNQLNRKISELNNTTQKLGQEKQDFINQLKLSNDRVNSLYNEVNRLEARNKTAENELKATHEDLTKQTSDKNQYFNQLKDANSQVNQLSQEKATLSDTLSKETKDKTFYSEQAKTLKDANESLADQVNRLSGMKTELEKKNTELTIQLRQEIGDKEHAIINAHGFERQIAILQNDLATLTAENATLKTSALSETEDFKKRLQQAEKEKSAFREQLTGAQANASTLTSQTQDLLAKCTLLENELSGVKQENSRNLEEKNRYSGELKTARIKITELENTSAALSKEVNRLSEKIMSLNSAIDDLNKDNKGIKTELEENNKYRAQVEETARNNMKILEKEISELRKTNLAMKDEQSESGRSAKVREAELKEQIVKSDGERNILKLQLAELKDKSDNFNKLEMSLRIRISELESRDQTGPIKQQMLSLETELREKLASVYLETNTPYDALRQFELLLRSKPNDPQTVYNIGSVYHKKLDNKAKAIEYYQRYLALVPASNLNPPISRLLVEKLIKELQ
jgi:chromosome segregation ATPase